MTKAEKEAKAKAEAEAKLAADTAAAEAAGLSLEEYQEQEAKKGDNKPSEKKSLTIEVMSGVNVGLVRTFEKGEEDAAESFKAKFNGRYI